MYSTCSIEPEENEDRVESFLLSHDSFTPEAAPASLVNSGVLTEEGHMATLPHRHGTDGAFGARLRRMD